jgi:hypothetical protein
VQVFIDAIEGPVDIATSLGIQLGERLLAAGAGSLLLALAAVAGR